MAVISGINDIKAKCLNSVFKKCRVVFRKGNPAFLNATELKLSTLINISIIKHKDTILCYCDGIKECKKEVPIEEEEILNEDVELEDPFSNYTPLEKEDLKEDIEFLYQKEKKDWIHRFSKNETLIKAIDLEYECDEEYCNERLNIEYPGFTIIDETTFFYKKSCPSLIALNLEQRLNLQLSTVKSKYGTYVRIVKLDQNHHINFNDQEAIVLFNYLNKFDVIALVSVVEDNLNGKQHECSRS